MTNFQNGDYLTPTLLNTRVPSWASSGNTGAMNAIAVANLPAPVLNVIVDYGAK